MVRRYYTDRYPVTGSLSAINRQIASLDLDDSRPESGRGHGAGSQATDSSRTSSRGDPTPDSSPSQSREESPTGYNQGPRFTEDKDGDVEMEDAEKSERKNDATADSALKQQNSLPRQRYTLPDEYRKNWPHVWRNVGQQNKYDVEMNGTESDDEEDDDSYVSRDSDDEDSESETESESESESESDTSDDGSDEDEWSSDDSSDDDEDEDDY